jgi:hypothetical protein
MQIHIEAQHEDRIAIRLADGIRVDALLTRETSVWYLRYVDPHGAAHVVELSPRRTSWATVLRIALKYCEERLLAWAGEVGPGTDDLRPLAFSRGPDRKRLPG